MGNMNFMKKDNITLRMLAYTAFVLLIFCLTIKIHSKLSKPRIHNNNIETR